MGSQITRLDKDGTVQLPASMRDRYGIKAGDLLVAEDSSEGILIRRASNNLEPEIYTPERKAEFLLSNAVTAREYAWAIEEVKRMGLDPEKIPHCKPTEVAGGRGN